MKEKYILIALALVMMLAGVFLFGDFFAYSPIIIGFNRIEQPHCIIYLQKGAEQFDYSGFDTLIMPVAKIHQLPFKRKPDFFIFRNTRNYRRLSPAQTRFCAIPTSRIFIAPWALKEAELGLISLQIYLKHELSHILIYQQTGFLRAWRFPKWLLEGIAVYTAGQLGTGWYPSRAATYTYIHQGNFLPPRDYKTHRASRATINVAYRAAFIYSEFGCIVDYLITTRGRERFQRYLDALFKSRNPYATFEAVYGQNFDQFITEFRANCSAEYD